jgi:hypothetical protein
LRDWIGKGALYGRPFLSSMFTLACDPPPAINSPEASASYLKGRAVAIESRAGPKCECGAGATTKNGVCRGFSRGLACS